MREGGFSITAQAADQLRETLEGATDAWRESLIFNITHSRRAATDARPIEKRDVRPVKSEDTSAECKDTCAGCKGISAGGIRACSRWRACRGALVENRYFGRGAPSSRNHRLQAGKPSAFRREISSAVGRVRAIQAIWHHPPWVRVTESICPHPPTAQMPRGRRTCSPKLCT
jgi:hypothetical protein